MRIMKLGEIRQKTCQKLKKWKNTRNIKYLRMVLILLIVGMIGIHILINIYESTTNSYDVLFKQRFIESKKVSEYDAHRELIAGFDLKERNFFYSQGAVIKNKELFGGSLIYGVDGYYDRALYNELTSVILNLQVSISEIKKGHYQIIRSPKSFVNKVLLKLDSPPEFEEKFLNKDSQFSKVRITYNKEFLPIKVEWYYKGKEGLKWYTWRTYSYPFENKADFDKRLDEKIQILNEIESEKETE